MFVAMNRFKVVKGKEAEFERIFARDLPKRLTAAIRLPSYHRISSSSGDAKWGRSGIFGADRPFARFPTGFYRPSVRSPR